MQGLILHVHYGQNYIYGQRPDWKLYQAWHLPGTLGLVELDDEVGLVVEVERLLEVEVSP